MHLDSHELLECEDGKCWNLSAVPATEYFIFAGIRFDNFKYLNCSLLIIIQVNFTSS